MNFPIIESLLKILAPEYSLRSGETRISSRIEIHSKPDRFPTSLWFQFQSDLKPSLDPDPFAVSLLLLAMQNQEPIEIEGSLSRKLFHGMNEYQKVFNAWYPDRFRIIDILPQELRDDPSSTSFHVACPFSGGVDSFYTLLSLLNERNSSALSHAVFMKGFDMPLNLTASIQELTDSYSALMKDKNISFIIGSTNVRNFVNSVDWIHSHGQALAATALFFKKDWKKFFIPSSYIDRSYPKWGTHPELDPLLSNESLEFVHHGAEANRVKKLALISQYEESYDRLRVCWIQDIGLKNCGECEKCVRTRIALSILGKLNRYRTFHDPKLDSNQIRGLPQRTHQGRLFSKELMKEAFKRGRFRILFDLGYSLLKRKLWWIQR